MFNHINLFFIIKKLKNTHFFYIFVRLEKREFFYYDEQI